MTAPSIGSLPLQAERLGRRELFLLQANATLDDRSCCERKGGICLKASRNAGPRA